MKLCKTVTRNDSYAPDTVKVQKKQRPFHLGMGGGAGQGWFHRWGVCSRADA